MDWQVILTSVVTSLVSSSVITAGVLYILKKSFDRALDYRFEKSLEESRLNAQETTRRQAAIFDKQVEVLKEVLSLTYRLRNATRDFAQQLDKEDDDDTKDIREIARKFRTYHAALVELVFEERALLPPLLFKVVHELRNRTEGLNLEIENLTIEKKSKIGDEWRQFFSHAARSFQDIDDLHQMIVNTVQAQLGIVKEKGGA